MLSIRKIYRLVFQPIVNVRDKMYEKKLRGRLKVHKFSILCPTCIGGHIYHRLGEQFMSPTINLWINNKEFIKFVCNLEHYMSSEMTLEKYAEGGEYGRYPVGRIDDILIHFNHDSEFEKAKDDWGRRKNRIQYDKLYIIAYETDQTTHEDLLKLKDITAKNIIVLSPKESDIEYVKTITPHLNRLYGERYLDRDLLLRRTYEKKWDFVKWLNCE